METKKNNLKERIILHKEIYSEQAIKKTIKSFKNLAIFRLNQKNNYYIVEFQDIRQEVKENFTNEFANFVLSSMQEF